MELSGFATALPLWWSQDLSVATFRLKLEYCNWTGTEVKVSKFISQSEKNQVDKLVLELIQELKKEIS